MQSIPAYRIDVPRSDIAEVVLTQCNVAQLIMYFCCVFTLSGSNAEAYQTYIKDKTNFLEFIMAWGDAIAFGLGEFNHPP